MLASSALEIDSRLLEGTATAVFWRDREGYYVEEGYKLVSVFFFGANRKELLQKKESEVGHLVVLVFLVWLFLIVVWHLS